MREVLRPRFWLETAAGGLAAVMLGITILARDWIEVVFKLDPDHHSGSVEWLLVATFVAVTVSCSGLAGSEWRRARACFAGSREGATSGGSQ